MDMFWKQLTELNAAVDDTRDRRINLQYLRCDVMRKVQDGFVNKQFRNELIKLKGLQSDLERMRDTVRQIINEAVRPFLRPLKILDLPDELLRHIFLCVRGDPSMPEYAFDDFIETEGDDCLSLPDIRQVKKLRLTCRRFCATSSHLLMLYVQVDMSPKSLARLDEVSRHPTISKGIRRVEICLGRHFDADIAYDLRAFARYQGARLRREIGWMEIRVQGPSFPLDPLENPAKLVQSIARAILVAESFEAADQTGLNENCPEHVLLREAHDSYRQQYEAQLLLQRGPFAQAVVSAMKRMPTAKWLSIKDDFIRVKYGTDLLDESIFEGDLESSDTLRPKLQAPSLWRMAPPIDAIFSILVSIGKAGICSNGLQIDVPWPETLTSFATAQAELLKRQTSSQQLEAFEFCLPSLTRLSIKAAHLLNNCLSTILSISSLRRIDLCFGFMYKHDVPHPTVSMAHALLSRDWPSLEAIRFDGPFCFKDLRNVVNHIDKDVELQWSGYLMDGSWAEILDLLRGCEQHTMVTIGDGAESSIAGAECESMSIGERCSIFSEDFSERRLWPESSATSYIRGWITQNPVTDWEDGDLHTTEDERMGDDEMEDDE